MVDPQTAGDANAGADPGSAGRRGGMHTIAGVPVARLVLLGGMAIAAIWSAWISKGLLDLRAQQTHIAKARLTEVVADYVQAAARSNSSPEMVTQQTAIFLRVLNDAVAARGANGQVVLLANAIVAGDVPDITDQIRLEVYAKIPRPSAASPAETQAQVRRVMANTPPAEGAANAH